MGTSFDEVVVDAMKLSLRDRVRLAQHLVYTLEDQVETDVEALWAAEAERRRQVAGAPAGRRRHRARRTRARTA